jgi:hypothetical protein
MIQCTHCTVATDSGDCILGELWNDGKMLATELERVSACVIELLEGGGAAGEVLGEGHAT